MQSGERLQAVNYFEHHIGDYDQATAHLTACEDGIYSRLIRWYMASEQPLPADQTVILRRVRAHTRDEKAAVRTVLAEFFELRDDGYHQHRCDEEIVRYRDKQAKARKSADARWSAQRSQSERNANASSEHDAPGMRTHSERNANGMHPASAVAPHPDAGARPSPDSIHQTPSSEAKLPRGRGSRLPANWEPGEPGFAFAAQQGLTNGRAQAEAEKFRDHWTAATGQSASKADWQAAWRNWVRKAVEYGPKSGTRGADDPFVGAH